MSDLSLTQLIFAITVAFVLSHVSMLLLLGKRDDLAAGIDKLTEGFTAADFDMPRRPYFQASEQPAPLFAGDAPGNAYQSRPWRPAAERPAALLNPSVVPPVRNFMKPQRLPEQPRLPYRMFDEATPTVPLPVAAGDDDFGSPVDWAGPAGTLPDRGRPDKAVAAIRKDGGSTPFIQHNYNF